MLKKRITTATFLIPILLAIIIQPNVYIFDAAIALFALALLWEFCGLIPLKNLFAKSFFMLAFVAFSISVYFLPLKLFLLVALLHWVFAVGFLFRFSISGALHTTTSLKIFWGIWIVSAPIICLHHLKTAESGVIYILLLMFLVWGSDIGAYFTGKALGKNKLCPKVSPSKTWEGFLGGLAVSILVAVCFVPFLYTKPNALLILFLLSIVTHCFSAVGDLFESMLKRLVNLKDSGHLLPGHGGIYDRTDSLTAAAPIFTLILLWSGWA